MNNYCKPYFKKVTVNKNPLKLKKVGGKIYYNVLIDLLVRKAYTFNKYVIGYDCSITLIKFNLLCVKLTVLAKTNTDYVKVTQYINTFNTNFLCLK